MSRMMHLFRKYQYMLLIVFGVLLMFVFVIGDALTNLLLETPPTLTGLHSNVAQPLDVWLVGDNHHAPVGER